VGWGWGRGSGQGLQGLQGCSINRYVTYLSGCLVVLKAVPYPYPYPVVAYVRTLFFLATTV